MPGRHNSSSIEGGIFGGPISNSRPQSAAKWLEPTKVSEGGIFGAAAEPAPPARTAVTKSSVEGGLFAEQAVKAPPSPRANNMTKSSVQGGIFGGYNHVDVAINRAPVAKAPVDVAAGSISTKSDAVSLTWSENAAPQQMQPPLSARSHKSNASSIPGGIFGSATPAMQPAARHNPNASSIPGGIFG